MLAAAEPFVEVLQAVVLLVVQQVAVFAFAVAEQL